MKLTTTAFRDGGAIPPEFAFGKPDPTSRVALSRRPHPAPNDPAETR